MGIRRKNPYKDLEKKLGYGFRKRNLIESALMHRSFRFENNDITVDNQRLEFLGDALLGFLTAAHLYKKFQDRDEGILTSLRSRITSGKALAELAARISLGEYIKMGKGEESSGGRTRSSNLADTLESVVGSVYLDGGMKAVQKVFVKLFVPQLNSLSDDIWAENPKGKLQEYSQRRWKKSPQYLLVHKDGPPHATVFTVEVVLGDDLRGVGKGCNKQDAEMHAATDVLNRLNRHKKR